MSSQATYNVTGTTPGSHTYRAVFTPTAGSAFEASQDSGDVVVKAASVKAASSVKESFPASVAAGKRASGVVTVVLAGVSNKATGSVKILKGTKVLVTKTLSAGKVSIKLPKLVKGLNKLKIVYGGSGTALGSNKSFTIKQK